jgi:hypothetical protein
MQSYWIPFWVLTLLGIALGGSALGELGAIAGFFVGSYLGFLVTAVQGWWRLRRAAQFGVPLTAAPAEPGAPSWAAQAEATREARLRETEAPAPRWGLKLLLAAGAGAILGAVVTGMATSADEVITLGGVIGAVSAGALFWIGTAGTAREPVRVVPAAPPPPAPQPRPIREQPPAAAPSPGAGAEAAAIPGAGPSVLPLTAAAVEAPSSAVGAVPSIAAPEQPLAAAAAASVPLSAMEPRFAMGVAAEPPVAAAAAPAPPVEPPREAGPEPLPETPELRSREAQILEHHSTWHRLLRPLLYENFVLFLGAFFILSGSVFGIADNWNRAGQWRPVLVVGAMALYTHLFFLLGYLLARKPALHSVALSILSIPVLLLPFLYVGLGLLLPDFVVLGLAGTVVLAGLDLACLLVVGSLHHRPFGRRFAWAFLALCLAEVVAGLGAHVPWLAGPTSGALVFVALYSAALRPFITRHLPSILVESARAAVFTLGSLLFAWLTLVGNLHFQRASSAEPVDPAAYGPLLVLLAAVALDVHRVLRGHPERAQHHELWRGLGLALVAGGVALALTAWLSGDGPKAALPLAALLATLLLVQAELADPRPVHLYGALLSSLIAYDTSPALFAGLAQAVVSTVSNAAGYGGKPLPPTYFALTFVPYLLALGALAMFRERRKKSPWPLLGWATAVAAAALCLALSDPDDLRPALAATVLYGLLALEVYRRWAAWGYLAAGLLALPLAVDLALVVGGVDSSPRLLASGVTALCVAAAGVLFHRRNEGPVASFSAGIAALCMPILWMIALPSGVRLDWMPAETGLLLDVVALGVLTATLVLATAGLPCLLFAYGACATFLFTAVQALALRAPPWMDGRLAIAMTAFVFCGLGLLLDRSGESAPERWLPWPRKAGDAPAPSAARLAAALAGPALRFAVGLALLGGGAAALDLGEREAWPCLALSGLTLLLVPTRRPQPLLALAGWAGLALAAYSGLFPHWTEGRLCLGLVGVAAALTIVALLFHAELWPRSAGARWTHETYGPPARWIAVGLLIWALLLSLDPFKLEFWPSPLWDQARAAAALGAAVLLLLHLRMTGVGLHAIAAGVAALWGLAFWIHGALPFPMPTSEHVAFADAAAAVLAQTVLLALTQPQIARWTLRLLTGETSLETTRKLWTGLVLILGLYEALVVCAVAASSTDAWAALGHPYLPGGIGEGPAAGQPLWLDWSLLCVLLALGLIACGQRLRTAAAIPGSVGAAAVALLAAGAYAGWTLPWDGLALATAAALSWDLAAARNWLGLGPGWASPSAAGAPWAEPVAELCCAAALLWGLMLSESDPRCIAAPLGMAVLGLALTAAAVRRRWALLLPFAAACFFAAPCLLLMWYGLNYPTGRPDEAILPFFGLVALGECELVLLLIRRLASRPSEALGEPETRLGRLHALLASSAGMLRWTAAGLRFLAVALAVMTAAGLADRANGIEAAATGLLLAALAAGWILRGTRADRPVPIHLGFLTAGLLLLYLRWLSPWFHALSPEVDTVFWIALGFLLLGVWRLQIGPSALRFALVLWSLLCPLGLVPLLPEASLGRIGSGLLAAGLLYTAVAWETRRSRLGLMAALVLNTGLVLLFLDLGLSHLAFYGLPIGATLLVLVQVEHDRLSRPARFHLQNLGIAILCGSAAFETFHAGDLGSFALLLGLCLAGIFAGIVLRIRAFLFCSTGILVATVLGQLLRASLDLALPAWILLTTLGMAIIGLTVLVSLKRQQLLAWYRLVTDDFSRWD